MCNYLRSVPIVVIQKLISFPLLYIKDIDDIHPIMGQETLVQDNLGVLFTPADHPVLFRHRECDRTTFVLWLVVESNGT